MIRSRPHLAIIASVLITACGGVRDQQATASVHVITAAALDALPRWTVTDGGRVCSADGRTLCPLHAAVANWLAPDRFALWEPGRQIGAWRIGDTVAVLIGSVGQGPGTYTNPSAVGATSGSDVLVVDAQTDTLLRYDGEGKFLSAKPLPKLFGLSAWGFAGRVAVLQRITARDSVVPAVLELRILKAAGDSAGRVALQTTIPFLHLNNSEVSSALPLFPTQPVYAIGDDGALTWSSADRLWVRRVNSSGGTNWTLSSDIKGAAIAPADLAARRLELEHDDVPAIDLDAMTARTPATHPAVAGILLGRDGRVLVGGAIVPSSDSVTYLMLSKDGVPLARLTLDKRVHPLLLSGDSLLVHRPTEGEPWEIRWLLLPKAH